MEQQQLNLDKRGNVYIITLTGTPHKANVFTIPLLKQLEEFLDQVEADTPCALVVTGKGTKFFSAGFDLKALTGASHNKQTNSSGSSNKTPHGQDLVTYAWKVLARLLVFPVPTIAVFNGHAFGLGLFLGLACDHRLMIDPQSRKAFLCLPEISIGLPLGSGFAALAKCKMNPSALRTSALTGKQWTATEALKQGIIDAIIPATCITEDNMLTKEVLEFAETLVPTSKKGNLSKIKMELYHEAYHVLAQRNSKL